ncbi:MAG: 6,7-dimethyl-8-ribityllumazine synthase [Thermoplasmata archaeon]|nr:MAG: 6,7-dimethyl-8-ribityllumazine synthase [Thermoplasmatales archaeon ex4484_6]RLF54468.1 MAG: 6,7-dimethyl-8-ribityllumazine synthase [Thermoplasmata archaeon]HHD15963.1 6,7-dimethyl-8-ribityllumazine synthase [Euryarchaeota archaeon]
MTEERKIGIGFVVSEYNFDITMMMLERAKAHAEFLGCKVKDVVMVPGVYDLPFALKRLIRQKGIDGVVAIGAVIEGETDHDEIVMQHSSRKIIDISLEEDKPVGLGITGPGMSRGQAQARIENARSAVEACVKLIRNTSKYV